MLRVVTAVFACLAVVGTACDSDDVRGDEASPTVEATAAPDWRPYLFRIDTLERVYELGVAGRIPLGFINQVSIDKAEARLDANNASVMPAPYALRLSMVMEAGDAVHLVDGGQRYEWRFARGPESDEPFISGEPEVFWTASLRFVDDAWRLFGDDGSGPRLVEGAEVVIGLYEISVTAPLGTDSPLVAHDVYYRALAYGVEPQVNDDFMGAGDVYPRDLTWRKVFEY
jgi:hypothetical protein